MKSKLFVSLSVALLIGATSCSDEVVVRNQQGGDLDSPMELTFSATGDEMVLTGNTSTRSLVREGKSVLWIANDRISVFAGEGTEYNYPFITKDGGVVTNYKGTVSHTPEKYYYALYSLINSTDDYRYTLNMIYKGDNGIENVIIHKDYQPIYNMAISPNGKTLVFTNFEMEGYAATFLYDIETGEKQELSLTDALPLNHAAFAYCWLDDRYLLMAEKLDRGTIAVGGDIYVYDTETEQCSALIVASQPELQFQQIDMLNDELILIKAALYEETYYFTEDVFFTVKTDRLYELIENGGSMTISPDDAI